jgi:hypothetical protein
VPVDRTLAASLTGDSAQTSAPTSEDKNAQQKKGEETGATQQKFEANQYK